MRYEKQATIADGDHVILHRQFSGFAGPAAYVVADVFRVEVGKVERLSSTGTFVKDEMSQPASDSGLAMIGRSYSAWKEESDTSDVLYHKNDSDPEARHVRCLTARQLSMQVTPTSVAIRSTSPLADHDACVILANMNS